MNYVFLKKSFPAGNGFDARWVLKVAIHGRERCASANKAAAYRTPSQLNSGSMPLIARELCSMNSPVIGL